VEIDVRKPLVVVALGIALAVAIALLLSSRGQKPGPSTAGGGASGRDADRAHRAIPPLNAMLTAPVPPSAGTLVIRGEVRGPSGPVAGATVTATTSRGVEVLSELRCHCGDDCGLRLLECGCPEAAGQLTELVVDRRGEAPPVARTETGADGRFVLTDLEEGVYAVWADSRLGTGLANGVRAGEEAVSIVCRSKGTRTGASGRERRPATRGCASSSRPRGSCGAACSARGAPRSRASRSTGHPWQPATVGSRSLFTAMAS